MRDMPAVPPPSVPTEFRMVMIKQGIGYLPYVMIVMTISKADNSSRPKTTTKGNASDGRYGA